jgi:uncharacterized protein (TIGR03083 family)
MAPPEHLDWFEENVAWFAALGDGDLAAEVPACPGWVVADVLTHLAYGLGRGYPVAAAAPPDATPEEAFAGLVWPESNPTGVAARVAFAVEMAACVSAFQAIDPSTPCWTYVGPGTAAFWFRRAAIETSLHRFDVAEALGRSDRLDLRDDRARDAIDESVTAILPLARMITGRRPSSIDLRIAGAADPVRLGQRTGRASATVAGSGSALLATLWGRAADTISVEGDTEALDEWSSLVAAAFG